MLLIQRFLIFLKCTLCSEIFACYLNIKVRYNNENIILKYIIKVMRVLVYTK